MANFKKGIALALVATTAFTFAPVANLGTPVVAMAADKIADTDLTNVTLVSGEKKTIKIADLTKLEKSFDGATATATIADKNIATFTASTDANTATTDPAPAINTPDANVASNLEKDDTVEITAGNEGSTTVKFEITNTNNEVVASQVININVSKKIEKVTLDKTELKATKQDKDTYKNASNASNDVVTATIGNINNGAQDTAHNYYLEVKSSNEKVATVALTTPATGLYAWSTSAYAANTFTVTYKGVGTATVVANVYRTNAADDSHKTLIATSTASVEVKDATDTLTVEYDGNRDGKADKTEALAKIGEQGTRTAAMDTNGDDSLYTDASAGTAGNIVSKTVVASTRLYLDTVENKTAKITASDSLGRQVSYNTTSNYFTVDNSGNVTVANQADRTSDVHDGFITVSVAKSGTGAQTISALTIRIPVTVYNKNTTALTVKDENGNLIAKTVGASNTTATTTESDLPTLYLSTKDKKTVALNIESASGSAYVSGNVYTALGSNQISDVVSYNNGTLTANKTGHAVVAIKARNNADTYGDATVYFNVEVVSKNANNQITVADKISLSKAANTATIDAKTTYATTLKYELVKAVGSDEAATSSDITVDAATGKITYTSANTGSVVVRITGKETSEALAPAPAYVTVSYDSTKATNTLAVANASITVKVGETATIGATASEGSPITYTVADPTIATVGADGTVTAVKAGATFVTVDAAETDTILGAKTIVPVVVTEDAKPVTVAKPAKVKSVTAKAVKGGKVKFTAKKVANAAGYQFVYTVGKKTVKKTTTKTTLTVKIGKGKKATVKVRAYNYKNGTAKQYGAFSAKKTVKASK